MLFGELRRKRKKSSLDESSSVTETEPSLPSRTALQTAEDDISGAELKSYAEKKGISVDDVWTMIKEGQLIARTENGFVYVYGSSAPAQTLSEYVDYTQNSLPPLPVPYERHAAVPAIRIDESPELLMLMEHLSLAKQQNQDLLKFANDSVQQMRSMTEEVIKSKDEVIRTRELEISARDKDLKSTKAMLERMENEKRQMMQDLEDLQMLNKTLMETAD